jgi:hypothetical protein
VSFHPHYNKRHVIVLRRTRHKRVRRHHDEFEHLPRRRRPGSLDYADQPFLAPFLIRPIILKRKSHPLSTRFWALDIFVGQAIAFRGLSTNTVTPVRKQEMWNSQPWTFYISGGGRSNGQAATAVPVESVFGLRF